MHTMHVYYVCMLIMHAYYACILCMHAYYACMHVHYGAGAGAGGAGGWVAAWWAGGLASWLVRGFTVVKTSTTLP